MILGRHSYVFVYANALGTREELIDFFNQLPGIAAWRYEIPNCFYIVADLTAEQLAHGANGRFGGRGYFLYVQYNFLNSEGWLPQPSWSILNEQKIMETDDSKRALEPPKR